jgi:hypothetical protein
LGTNEEVYFLEKELERVERDQREVAFYLHLPATHQLGLPKFHVLSFWNWLGINLEVGYLSSNNNEGRKKNTHNHHNNNNNNNKRKGKKNALSFVGTHCPINDDVYVYQAHEHKSLTTFPQPPPKHTHKNTLVVYIQICVCIQHMVSGLVFKTIGFWPYCLDKMCLVVPLFLVICPYTLWCRIMHILGL